MKVGQKISFNKSLFNIVFIDDNEIRVENTTTPNRIVSGSYKPKEKLIKLMGWSDYISYELV